MRMKTFYLFLLISFGYTNFVEWEPSSATMIRWPLGLSPSLVIELSNDELLYVLTENGNQQTQANTASNNCGINSDNIGLIEKIIYNHYIINYGPKFLIGDESYQIINQQFNGFLDKNSFPEDYNNNMSFID